MAIQVLGLYGLYFLFAFGMRIWLQLRRTGSTGLAGIGGGLGATAWIAGVLFVITLASAIAAPILATPRRNPIYAAMILASLGLCLCVPNVLACVAWLALVATVELQVRAVEEPHLLRAHGREYARYAATVGRFIPRVGRLLDRRAPSDG
jgi:hypothetical protein